MHIKMHVIQLPQFNCKWINTLISQNAVIDTKVFKVEPNNMKQVYKMETLKLKHVISAL